MECQHHFVPKPVGTVHGEPAYRLLCNKCNRTEAELRQERAITNLIEPLEGVTIQVSVQFNPDDTRYTYVAYHAQNGKWYVSGQTPLGRILTWEQVLVWLNSCFWHSPVITLKRGTPVHKADLNLFESPYS